MSWAWFLPEITYSQTEAISWRDGGRGKPAPSRRPPLCPLTLKFAAAYAAQGGNIPPEWKRIEESFPARLR